MPESPPAVPSIIAPLTIRLVSRILRQLLHISTRLHPLHSPPLPLPSPLDIPKTLQEITTTPDAALAAALPSYATLSALARPVLRMRFAALLVAAVVKNPFPPLCVDALALAGGLAPPGLVDVEWLRGQAYELACGAMGSAAAAEGAASDHAACIIALELLGVARGEFEACFLVDVAAFELGDAGLEAVLVGGVGLAQRVAWASGEDKRECGICLEEYGEGEGKEEAVRLKGCGHVFGKDCVRSWLRTRNTYCVCRKVVYRYQPCRGEGKEMCLEVVGADGEKLEEEGLFVEVSEW